ncbi:DNA-binding response regulator [Actinorhabdospora filicis]|uniref:DNA-binding response regulator n=1 Tax=Actinorhabdospora filicis TaxID=1785913 RepID=A0A9W6SH11_9ACTN|nr:response regulator transcription factor [Actinorhabdospora filicis]GLZ75840.1 DNA-binding response regulator [Actinorhabdospora filicis]
MIKVLIADDQRMVRTGFAMILGAQPDIEVVGEAEDGVAAVEMARRLRPDVCLFDIRMPRLDGLEATRLIAGPDVRDPLPVIIVTTFDHDEYVYRALRDGACGFLLKDGGPALLIEAVRAAAAGDAMIAPAITVRLLKQLTRPKKRVGELPVTDRELELVRLIARGTTNEEIAERLHITLSTVKTHVGSVMRKIGARNRVEIAAWAWEQGLME